MGATRRRRLRSGAAMVAAALVLPALTAPAPAWADPVQPISPRALDALHAVAFVTGDAACDVEGLRLVASSDRGATWQPRECVPLPSSEILVDPTTATVDYAAGDRRHVTIQGDGSVRFRPIAGSGAVLAVDAGALYAAPAVGSAALERIEGAAAVPCGNLGLGATLASQLTVEALPGVLVVTAPPEDAAAAGPSVRVSIDRCASFGDLAPPAGCQYAAPAGPATLIATCGDGTDVRQLRLDAVERGWVPAPAYLSPATGSESPIFVERDESRVHAVDALSVPSLPAGWPVPRAAAGPAPPAGDAAAAVELVNARYRRPLGLPDLAWSPVAAVAAVNHAEYYARNGYSGHDETPGEAGYTGVSPVDRCTAAATDDLPCSEVAFELADMGRAVEGWLATPFHGAPFLEQALVGLGSSRGGSVGDFPTPPADGGAIWDLRADANVADAAIRAWPADGATNVPTTWWGGESPDPLAGYAGDPRDVGPVLFFFTPLAPLHVSLTRVSDGDAVRLLRGGDDAGAREQTVQPQREGFGWLFAARRLAPGTRYRLVLRREDGWTRTLAFSTDDGSGPRHAPPALDAVPGPVDGVAGAPARRCRIVPVVRRQGRTTVVVFRRAGSCRGVIVQRRVARRWRAVRPTIRVVAPAAVVWRARIGRTPAGHGVVRVRVVRRRGGPVEQASAVRRRSGVEVAAVPTP